MRESVDLAATRSGGAVTLRFADAEAPGGWRTEAYRTRLLDPSTGGERRPPAPQSFSFHAPRGACPACGGAGLADPDTRPAGRRPLSPAPPAAGERLNPESLAVRVDGLSIGEAGRLSVDDAAVRFDRLGERIAAGDAALSAGGAAVAGRLLPDVSGLLNSLRRVGLGYLTLDRRVGTSVRRRVPPVAVGGGDRRSRHRRLLCAGRTHRRPAPRRRRPPVGPAGRSPRRREHGAAGRARPGPDPPVRSSDRPRPRRRRRRRRRCATPDGRTKSSPAARRPPPKRSPLPP